MNAHEHNCLVLEEYLSNIAQAGATKNKIYGTRGTLRKIISEIAVTLEAATESEIIDALRITQEKRGWVDKSTSCAAAMVRALYQWLLETRRIDFNPLVSVDRIGAKRKHDAIYCQGFDTTDPLQFFEYKGKQYSAIAVEALYNLLMSPGKLERCAPLSQAEATQVKNAMWRMRNVTGNTKINPRELQYYDAVPVYAREGIHSERDFSMSEEYWKEWGK